ncbi:unnamed protein product [Adineta ricciae]|uniref:Uncharacterized protein n=1 Tax=Adineta ricciae TaxID=249248 RepID=A0A814CZ19_ADIRI|nr:unnamed protein product [Adineta ricciae]
MFENTSYSAMLHIWESVPHTESVPTIPEFTRSNSGIHTHNYTEFLPIPELHPLPSPSHIISPIHDRIPFTEFRNSVIPGIARNSVEFLPIPTDSGIAPNSGIPNSMEFRGIPTNSGITPTPFTLTYHLPYTPPNSVYGIPEFSHTRNR